MTRSSGPTQPGSGSAAPGADRDGRAAARRAGRARRRRARSRPALRRAPTAGARRRQPLETAPRAARTSARRTWAPAAASARSVSRGVEGGQRVRVVQAALVDHGHRGACLAPPVRRVGAPRRRGGRARRRRSGRRRPQLGGAEQLGLARRPIASAARPGMRGSAGSRAATARSLGVQLSCPRCIGLRRRPDAAASTSSRTPAIVPRSAASTLSRSSGSVLEARTLNHHIGSPLGGSTRQPVELVELAARGPRPTRRPRPSAAAASVDRRVDLAGGDIPARRRPPSSAQRAVLLAERGQHVHGGEHAGVGVPEVAEVVVRRVLAAEDGLGARPSRP